MCFEVYHILREGADRNDKIAAIHTPTEALTCSAKCEGSQESTTSPGCNPASTNPIASASE